ncbi:MAG: DUF937 domain-containing protein [Burkholderiales bacterium]|nr:DUF937 domain-containing protein [Burkholderiales bacterium]
MNNLILSQALGGVFGTARARRNTASPLGGGLGRAAIGGILAGMLRSRGARGAGMGRGALLAMLLPYAMQWIQRNGGLGAVLERMQDKGLGRQANSWVSTGDNQDLDPQSVAQVMNPDELEAVSRQLGLPADEVKQGFAEILPEMVNQLTPDGRVPAEADDILKDSIPLVEQELAQARAQETVQE